MTIADGNQREAHLIKVTHAVVGNVPAQAAVQNFVVFVALGFPLFRGKMAEGGQLTIVLFTHGFQLTQSFVNFRTFHLQLSF